MQEKKFGIRVQDLSGTMESKAWISKNRKLEGEAWILNDWKLEREREIAKPEFWRIDVREQSLNLEGEEVGEQKLNLKRIGCSGV